jgi:UDP-N-acetyl-D-mannosaminuronic acid dehydrogenase
MTNSKPSVVMLGLGYIGLPTAALIASKGLQVTGVDIREDVVDTINKGEIHIVEPDLDGLVHHALKKGLLKASMIAGEADVFLIAVPTPFKGEFKPDISYVEKAIDAIIPVLKEGNLIIIESTSPVGTTEKMQQFIIDRRPDLEGKFYMAYCPERVLPGNIMHELEKNDRAIGGINEISTEKAISFYKYFVKGELHKTNARTAEMCKLVENASRDGQIAFANELSIICDKAGIDVWELIHLANKHPRVNILQPGTGVGGHCIAVDPWFIVSEFPKESNLIRKAREVNTYKTQWVIEKIKNEALKFEIAHKKQPLIACMGLAFKPNIDDLRESPAVTVVEALEKEGLPLLKVEPNLKDWKEEGLTSSEDALNNADIIVFLVAHTEFHKIRTDKIVLDFNGIRNV